MRSKHKGDGGILNAGEKLMSSWRRFLIFLKALAFVSLISLITFVCIKMFARTAPILGILVSTVTGCVLMVPVTILLLPFVQPLLRHASQEQDKLIYEQQKQIDMLEQKNAMLEESCIDYGRRLMLLENLTVNMNTFKDVFKVCFRDCQQVSTIKQREKINFRDGSVFGHGGYDEVLAVMDCRVSYQRGVDLQNIMVSRINDDTVVVSGIEPEYTSRPRFEYKDFFCELRSVELDRKGDVKKVSVKTGTDSADSTYQKDLDERRNLYKADFEDEFTGGLSQNEDASEIVRKTQDIIRILLEPIFSHVEFDDSKALDSVPLLELLNSERNLCLSKLKKNIALPEE